MRLRLKQEISKHQQTNFNKTEENLVFNLLTSEISRSLAFNDLLCKRIHSNKIVKILGNVSRNRDFIRRFITKTSGYQVGIQSFEYTISDFNALEIYKVISKSKKFNPYLTDKIKYGIEAINLGKAELTVDIARFIIRAVAEVYKLSYMQEIKDMKEFRKNLDYVKSSLDRNIHPIQNFSRENRGWVFSDIAPIHADVNNSMFTIVHEEVAHILDVKTYHKISDRKRERAKRSLEIIENYINNKSEWRQHICDSLGIDEEDAKALLLGTINGSRLSPTVYSKSFLKHLGGDNNLYYRLRNDKLFKQLREASKNLWDVIFTHRERALNISTPKSKRKKMEVYAYGESNVRNAMKEFIAKIAKTALYVDEHDGFRTDIPFVKEELEKYIEQSTGYRVTLTVKYNNQTNNSTISVSN